MFGSLRKRLEEATAQLNPFDQGRTAATVRASRTPPPPAQTQRAAKIPYRDSFRAPQPRRVSVGVASQYPASLVTGSRDIKLAGGRAGENQGRIAELESQANNQNLRDRFLRPFDANTAADRAERLRAEQPEMYREQQQAMGRRARNSLGEAVLAAPVRLLNTGKAGVGGLVGLGQIGATSAFGSDQDYANRVRGVSETLRKDLSPTSGLLGYGTAFDSPEEAQNISPGRLAAKTLGYGAETAAFGVGAPGVGQVVRQGGRQALTRGLPSFIARESAAGGLGSGGEEIGSNRNVTPTTALVATGIGAAAGPLLAGGLGVAGLGAKAGARQLPKVARKVDSAAFATPESRVSVREQNILRDYSDRLVGVNKAQGKELSDLIAQARSLGNKYGVDLTNGSVVDRLERTNAILDQIGAQRTATAQGGYARIPGKGKDPLESLKQEAKPGGVGEIKQSFGNRKLTNQQLYGDSYIKSTYNGKPITTNSYILEFEDVLDNPKFGKARRVKEGDTPPVMEKVLEGRDNPKTQLTPTSKSEQFVELSGGENSVVLDGKYVTHMLRKHGDDVQFFADNKFDPVFVKKNGETVGIIMPVKENAKNNINFKPLTQSQPSPPVQKPKSVGGEYRSTHQITDKTPISQVNLDELKESVRKLDGYITNSASSDFNKLKRIQANPDADVKIYRASPVNEINDGDWVTTSKTYANDIKRQNGGKVYEHTVKAKDLNLPKNIEDNPSLARFSAFQYSRATQPTKGAKPTQKPTPFEQDLQAAGIKPQQATRTQSTAPPPEPATSPQPQAGGRRLSSPESSSYNNTPLPKSEMGSLMLQVDSEMPSFNAVAGAKGSKNATRLVDAINADNKITKAAKDAQNNSKEINFFAKKDSTDRSVGIEQFNPTQHRIEAGFVVDSEGNVLGNHIKVDETGIQVNVGGDLVNMERVIGNPLDWKGKYRLSETMSRNIDSNAPDKQIAGQTKDFLVGSKVKAESNYRVELQEKYNELGKRIKTVNDAKPRNVSKKQFEDDIFSVLNGDKTDADIRGTYGAASKAILDYKKETRTLYDSLLERINSERVKFGQAPVEGRKDYITHLQELSSNKKFTGEVYNAIKNSFVDEGTQKTRGGVPGSIAGRTENFKPLSSWNRFLQRRKGDKSLRDPFMAVQAYLEPALYNIHMTEATVRARAVEAAFRTASQLQEMTGDQVVKQANDLLSPYKGGGADGKLVAGFQEYANSLARKTQRFDRQIIDASNASATALRGWQGLQRAGGRATILGNVSSVMAQPLNQVIGIADAGPTNYLKGVAKTLGRDKAIESSSFIKARRTQAKAPIRGKAERALDAGGVPLQKVEMASIEIIWNSQHAKAKSSGLTGQKAIQQADYNTERLVAGRGIADRPEAYRSTLANGLLQYTLEVNAQNKAFWKDLSPRQKATFLVAAAGVNSVYGAVTGFQPLPDFLKAAIDTGSDFTDAEDERSVGQKAIQGGQRLVSEYVGMNPFFSAAANTVLTQPQRKTFFGEEGDMGRFEGTAAPVQVVKNTFNAADNLRQGNLTAARNDALRVIPYGNQARKTTTGAEANASGYAVDKSGNPTFAAPNDFMGQMQNLLFGPSSTNEARSYYDNNQRNITGKRDLETIKQASDKGAAVRSIQDTRKQNRELGDSKKSGTATLDNPYELVEKALATEKDELTRLNDYDNTQVREAVKTVREDMNKELTGYGLPEVKVSSKMAREYALYKKRLEGKDEIGARKESESFYKKTYKSQLPQKVQSFYNLGDDDMLASLRAGEVSKEDMDKVIEIDNILTSTGLQKYPQVGKKLRQALGYKQATSPTGKKSGGRAKSKKGKYDYKLFGLISDPLTTSKSLRQLLKEASIS